MGIFKNGVDMATLVVFPRDGCTVAIRELLEHPFTRFTVLRDDNCCNTGYFPILPIGTSLQFVVCCVDTPKNSAHPPIV